jgi:uncharacterized protein (TIGR02996 family)
MGKGPSPKAATAATNPEIEAAIIDNPNDLDGYLVYGDWLQAEGDPRGELIALQAAQVRGSASSSKDSAAINKSIDKIFSKHAATLLGDLTKYSEKELKLDWHLGFIESAQIQIASQPIAEAALTMLVRHPSARFLRSLWIAPVAKGKRVDPQPFVQILLDEKQPKTLTDLHIGGPGTWDIDAKESRGAELVKVFPRLLKSLDAVWSGIMQEISDTKRLDPKYDPDEQPDLIPLRNIDVGKVDKGLVLKGLRIEIDKGKDLGLVNAMKRAFTVDSLDRFAVALGDQFTKLGETTALRWGFEAMGAIGHDLAAEWIGTRLRSWSHQRSVQGAEILGKIGSGGAIYELYGLIADPTAYRPRRDQASGQLDLAAARAKFSSVSQLLDRIAPTTVVPGSTERIRNAISRRFYYDMIEGRKMKAHDFRHYVVEHPFVAPLARRVLFASYGKGAILDLFRVDDNGRLVDDTGTEVEVDDRVIGVMHPAEIKDVGERQTAARKWKQVFQKAKAEPLFQQIDRPVFDLRENETGTKEITRFKLRRGEFDRMRRTMEFDRDWYVNDQHDQGGVAEWARFFKRDEVTVFATLGSYGSTIESLRSEKEFSKLSPVTVSEILFDVETATTKPKPEPASSKPAAKKASTSRGAAVAMARIEAEDGEIEVREVEVSTVAKSDIEKGSRVRVARGYEARLKCGVVFWIGEKNGAMRVGMRADDGKTHWLDLANLDLAKADDKVPEAYAALPQDDEDGEETDSQIEKGMKVSWDNGRHSGTGFVFWLGANKFGGGTRAGVKDDETGETVWLDVKQCAPLGVSD